MGTELQELEARPSWVVTFEHTNPEVRGTLPPEIAEKFCVVISEA